MSFVQEYKSLKPYNSFAIDVKSRFFIEIRSEADLVELLRSTIIDEQELLVLGGGSNVLFTSDFKGFVVKVSIPGISASTGSDDEVLVTAGAGVVWNDFVNYCVGKGFAGVENLTLIPGTVGASPIQNIGAYGVELKDVFHSCKAYNILNGKARIFDFQDCRFGYRDSIFKNELKNKYIISSVTFKLSRTPNINIKYGAIKEELSKRGIENPGIADISAVVAAIRVSKLPDPSTIGNAGSFFKNPVIDVDKFRQLIVQYPDLVNFPASEGKVKVAAGWLIEQCGFKGIVVGNTGTWKNQALVLVNHGGATGHEVYSFSERIIMEVNAKFGIMLEREVNIL
jgi:UDP-N-acetylmuramate dehydrogenase